MNVTEKDKNIGIKAVRRQMVSIIYLFLEVVFDSFNIFLDISYIVCLLTEKYVVLLIENYLEQNKVCPNITLELQFINSSRISHLLFKLI